MQSPKESIKRTDLSTMLSVLLSAIPLSHYRKSIQHSLLEWLLAPILSALFFLLPAAILLMALSASLTSPLGGIFAAALIGGFFIAWIALDALLLPEITSNFQSTRQLISRCADFLAAQYEHPAKAIKMLGAATVLVGIFGVVSGCVILMVSTSVPLSILGASIIPLFTLSGIVGFVWLSHPDQVMPGLQRARDYLSTLLTRWSAAFTHLVQNVSKQTLISAAGIGLMSLGFVLFIAACFMPVSMVGSIVCISLLMTGLVTTLVGNLVVQHTNSIGKLDVRGTFSPAMSYFGVGSTLGARAQNNTAMGEHPIDGDSDSSTEYFSSREDTFLDTEHYPSDELKKECTGDTPASN